MKIQTKLAALSLALTFATSTISFPVLADTTQVSRSFEIANPYENVDWDTFGQFKAAHHTHTTFSDGSNTRRDMLLDKYAKGFDIVAITDHDTTTPAWNLPPGPGSRNDNWNNIGTAILGSLELLATEAGLGAGHALSPGTYRGIRQQANGMIGISYSNEIAVQRGFLNEDGTTVYRGYHINSFWADVPGNIGSGRTMQEVIRAVQDAGGITHLNHPGRYTGAQHNAALSKDPAHINRHVSLFMEFPSLIGMEIINKWDGESINDRILWDQILMQTMPQGRPVWGFSNDDSHSLSGNGHAWNVMLMPELTEAATRISMETGAFYGVSRVDRVHGINTVINGVNVPGAPAQTTNTATQHTGGAHNEMALAMLAQPDAPSISNIVVGYNTITISGADFNRIEWIADGVVVYTGTSIDVSAVAGINSYIRAELIGTYGVAYTQPFGITAPAPKFSLNIFNNGNSNNASLANLGVIRMWAQLDGTNALAPYASLEITAELTCGADAKEFVRINRAWNNTSYVNLIDVRKTRDWQQINFTATLFGQTINVLLVNDTL
ncbi:MAG: hypothetical protein FWC93_00310 [Defluviitaleaceae bacterium]|nr:hypothetical protein [Defluviitaleaceae bacterium]